MNRNKLPVLVRAFRRTGECLAEEECAYRQLLTKEAIRLHKEEGAVWSVCESLAKGSACVASVRLVRDKLLNEYTSLRAEIKTVLLEMELQEKELEREYKARRVG